MATLSDSEPRRALVFIGFMGAGKTRAAEAVAAALDEPWADSDREFERIHGAIHGAFTSERGEAAFREAEQEVVLELLARGPRVIALGGGAVETPAVREALRDHVVVWRQISLEEARRRVDRGSPDERPLAADREGFRARYERRQPLYAELATAILPEGDRGLAARAAPALAALRSLPAGTRMAWGRSGSGEYPVYVGSGLLAGTPRVLAEAGVAGLGGRAFCVTDETVAALQREALGRCDGTVVVPAGEAAKTLTEAERVMRELAAFGATRSDHLLALGGGVVGDLAGFCAATYQRGIPVVQVPTTLVAQVDAAYGGKTGVDIPEAKNYVGAYHMPSAVIADPAALATLPAAELASGFAEVLKTGLIAGGELWQRVRELAPGSPPPEEVIFGCARTKLAIVAADERDAGRRQVLNLGHTVGHAIEAASGYELYRHGEAVGLGLLAVLRLAGAEGLREEVAALLSAWGLPTRLDARVPLELVMEAVGRDKKRDPGGVPFVLLERPGEPRVGARVEADSVRAAVEELRG